MLRDVLWQEKEQKTRQLVESGYSVLAHYHDLQLRGELSQAQAQAGAIGTIKAMRYDETEYFWLTDLGLPFPKMVMHPTMPALDGQVLDSDDYNRAISLRAGSQGAFTPHRATKIFFTPLPASSTRAARATSPTSGPNLWPVAASPLSFTPSCPTSKNSSPGAG